LLLTRDMSSPKHSGVMALFNRHFIKEGVLPLGMGKFYSSVFDRRLEGDYGDIVELKDEDIRADLTKAEEFIARIECQLKRLE
jgi:uncharacterized protein (UPF0332 family)